MEHSSAAAVTVSNTADTELIAYFADCKTYSENSGLKFWVTNTNKYPLLAPLAQDLLSAPASEAYVERVFSICGELTAYALTQLKVKVKVRTLDIAPLRETTTSEALRYGSYSVTCKLHRTCLSSSTCHSSSVSPRRVNWLRMAISLSIAINSNSKGYDIF